MILGIKAYHGDLSASLIIDATLVAAVEKERFKRKKHLKKHLARRFVFRDLQKCRKCFRLILLCVESEQKGVRNCHV